MTFAKRYLFLSLISLICFTSAEHNLKANSLSQTLQNVLTFYDDLHREIDEFNLYVAQLEHLTTVPMLKFDCEKLRIEEFKKKIGEMNHTIHELEYDWSKLDTQVYMLETEMRTTVKEIRSLKLMTKITEMKLDLLASSFDQVLVSCNRETERNGYRLAFIAEYKIFLVSTGIVFSFLLGSLILTLPLMLASRPVLYLLSLFVSFSGLFVIFFLLFDTASSSFTYALKWLYLSPLLN